MDYEKLKTSVVLLARTPLSYFGLAFYRAWLNTSIPEFSSFTVFHALNGKAVFDLVCAVTALFVAITLSKGITRNRGKAMSVSVVLMALSTLGLAVSESDPGSWPVTALLSCVLGAIGLMTLSLLWIEFYASFNPIRMAAYYSVALVMGEALTVALLGYDGPYLLAARIVMLAASALCLVKARKSEFHREESRNVSHSYLPSFPWKPALLIGTYAFAFAVSGSGLSSDLFYPEQFFVLIPPVAVLLSVMANSRRFDFFKMYGLALPLMVCGFLFLSVLPSLPDGVSSIFISVSYASASMLVVLIICGVSYRSGTSALRLFGIVRFVQYVSMAAGIFLNSLLDGFLPSTVMTTVLVPLAMIMLVVIVSVVFVTERDSYFGWKVGTAPQSEGDSGEAAMAMRIDHVKETCRLTQREHEVLQQLSRGKTISSIAEDMFIAEGTVKAHVQHIYTKLDVHSRDELFEFLQRVR